MLETVDSKSERLKKLIKHHQNKSAIDKIIA